MILQCHVVGDELVRGAPRLVAMESNLCPLKSQPEDSVYLQGHTKGKPSRARSTAMFLMGGSS